MITSHDLMHTLADVLTLQCTWPTQLLHVSNTGAVSALMVSPLLPHLYRMLNTTYKSSLATNLHNLLPGLCSNEFCNNEQTGSHNAGSPLPADGDGLVSAINTPGLSNTGDIPMLTAPLLPLAAPLLTAPLTKCVLSPSMATLQTY